MLTEISSFVVTPLERTSEKKYNFGARVTGVDLNDISDDDVDRLKAATWRHKLIVVKYQQKLDPKKQWELVTRLDPKARDGHSHGNLTTFRAKGGLLAQGREVVGIPGAENVRLIGKGFQGEDHFGIKNHSISRGLSNDFHAIPPSLEDFENGITRFQRWHIDAPLYGKDPAWFTTLRCIKLPQGPDLTVQWADGSGYTMETPPGQTAFFSTSQLYTLLTPEEQKLVDHSWVEYAPHPYKWIERCKGNSNGLGLAEGGERLTLEELGDFDPSAVKKYPMVWVNPLTGDKAFQVHGICARKLYLRSSQDEQPRVIDDLSEIRKFILDIQNRILKPEYILLPPTEEGDMIIWDNYGLFHSAIDYPIDTGPRTMHQANISGSSGPNGPVPIPSVA
ncbi:hypothetical protein N7491_007397 [Penicillium cf. griseofulvum]|uniref:TauD/TfdA-like domain-containing protein n=1 Tax=Penicillium cf. griseofulvum TaxID=2972120 RepID=A0A9W9M149_9EURO|nr:hypothetical protein N7472_009574 [Penicillium cf. griseofulvum]KAJ5430381.1 hypothetical protein N7491_007397 [Penicillium cf. griseofulvum]KAJ5435849.1 hypothetical protein N7445_006734 [Penicillium cf. griseofulvum]